MKSNVTLKHIAKAAGVHVSTVSRALDPNSKTPLTNEVTERIKQIAADLGYRPNRLAAGLRTRRTMSVGVMIPDVTNTLFPPLIRGIESVLEPLGYTSILVNSDEDLERERRQIEVLREHGVDGIISGAAHRDDPALATVARQGLPVVTMNRKLDNSEVPYVINDEDAGFKMLVNHLASLGHSRLGYISGPLDLSTGIARLEAFKRNCTALGIRLDDADIVVAKRYDESEGRDCAKKLLSRSLGITALVCANDRLAIGAYEGLRDLGIKVPQDISVTGFNDNPMLELIPPKLTTVRIQQFKAGAACATMLLKVIAGEVAGPVGTILPVELVVRESTAAAPRG